MELSNIFRTDRGDHEVKTGEECEIEWDYLRIQDHNDQKGDDDVLIVITSVGKINVKYIDN